MSQHYAEFTLRPARTYSLWTMGISRLSTRLSPFSVSVSLDFPCTAHAFLPERLSNRCTFSEICTEFDAVPLSAPSRNRIRPDTRLQIKGCKILDHPPSCVKLCTLTPKICQYYHLPLHSAFVVQMTAPVPEIMDTPSYVHDPLSPSDDPVSKKGH
jgi:hypothetical protein